MIKQILKKIVPIKIRHKIRALEHKIFGLDSKYKNLSTEDVFDNIYEKGIWGKDEQSNSTSGTGSHKAEIVDPYVNVVKKVITDNDIKTAVDLGCGDFAVGSLIVDCCETYNACDISNVILEKNRSKYQSPKLKFEKLDLSKDVLPHADIAFVRQVLQHLSNENIKSFVQQLNDIKNFKYLLITEHLPFDKNFLPNKNKPNGPNIRIAINSGVILHNEPFNLNYKTMETVLSVDQDTGGSNAVIQTTLYKL